MTDDAGSEDIGSEDAADPGEATRSAADASAAAVSLGGDPGGELAPEALARLLRDGEPVSVLDVRDRPEFEAWRVDGRTVTARHVPHMRFIAARARGDPAAPLPDDLAEPVVVVCGRGEASAEVADQLAGAGVDAVNLAGGMDAWARVYLAEPVLRDDDVTVIQYQRPSSGCLAYLVVAGGDGENGRDGSGGEREAAVIDPLRAFADRYAAAAAERGATLRYAVDTHVHADHVSGVRAVREATGAAAVLPEGAAERGLAFDATLLADGERLGVGGLGLEAIHAPGHTSELTCLRLRRGEVDEDAADVLFTGDALFLRSVGRPDLEAGDEGERTGEGVRAGESEPARGGENARALAERAYDSLHDRLLALPEDTVVAPGHVADPADARADDYVAPLARLRDLDVLRLDRGAFVDRVAGDLPPRPANHERIVATNLGTESMADDEAFEAELGPNNCAVN